jgi:hypothetical protein
MGLTPNLTVPIGHYHRTFLGPRYTICQVVTPRIPLRSHSHRTPLQLAAGGSICVVGAPAHACISTRRFNGAAGRFLPSKQGVNHSSCAADPRLYAECFKRAISRTGATLHAGITISNFNLAVGEAQDRMRTDEKTGATTHAFFSIKSQCDNILQIDQLARHVELLTQRIANQPRE